MAKRVEAASRRLKPQKSGRMPLPPWLPPSNNAHAAFFDPHAPLTKTQANLPHWKQDPATYFVTFRLADALPQERLQGWVQERDAWLATHPEPHSEGDETEYHTRFSAVIEAWLDQGAGSCVLNLPECSTLVTDALRHFDSERYALGEFVVASNHVHALVVPLPGNDLSGILHSWKSFTAKQIIKVEAASRRFQPWWDKLHPHRPVWQKESFDHIVRSSASLQRFEAYIRDHREWEE